MWVFEETPPRTVHRVVAYDDRYQPIRLAGLSGAGEAKLIPGQPQPSATQSTRRPTATPTRRPSPTPTRPGATGSPVGMTPTPAPTVNGPFAPTPTPMPSPTRTLSPTVAPTTRP